MPKTLKEQLDLDALLGAIVDIEIDRLGLNIAIACKVDHDPEKIIWGQDGQGVCRAPWHGIYDLPTDHWLRPILNAKVAWWQERFDLSLPYRRTYSR